MLSFINIKEHERWDKLITTLPVFDIYYLSGYVKAFSQHGDGDPYLLWYEQDNLKGACVIMIRDIAEDCHFDKLEKGQYFDAITPYGYGGFIFNRNPTTEDTVRLKAELFRLLKDEKIISVFFRFHPMLKNSEHSRDLCQVVELGKTISIDTRDSERIWDNIISKNRNVIRKAEKSGVTIHQGKGMELLEKFKEIYDCTMTRDNAIGYYFFNREFYESIENDLKDNYTVFYAMYNDKIISIAIIIFADKLMHYHLSGSLFEYRHLAPSNLLLYKAAIWGCENGYESFHLGGGLGSSEDNLFKFKAAFNRNSDNQFAIGKIIVDEERYSELVNLRKSDSEIDINSTFFPLYRS